MKALVVLLGLITATVLSGVAAVTVRIRAYNATGELDIGNNVLQRRDDFTLSTRLLLTCDVTGLPEGSEVVSYRWYHSCTGLPNSGCEIQDRDPYYRVANGTLLVDVTSWDHGGRYYCTVHYLHEGEPKAKTTVTLEISVASNPVPFLYTPTSLLPENSVLTDVQQATGRNGQQWITCKSEGQTIRPTIWIGRKYIVPSSSTDNSVTIALDTHHPNGLYLCFIAQSQKQYFSLFLRNSVTLPTPTVSAQDTSMWTIVSPDGSRVKRYIIEFECSVRSITFVEKYMSISTSGGTVTGQVAKNASCFGGLGQLYRVKVWAVSGPNISRALVCIPDGQCMEEGALDEPTLTIQMTVGGHTTTMESSPIPQHDGTRTGVGVGIGVFLLLVLSILVVLTLVVVVVRRKAACKQKRKVKMGDNPCYNNTVVEKEGLEMKERDLGAYYMGVDNNSGEERGSLVDGFDPYKEVDRQPQLKNAKRLAPKESALTASATNMPAGYAIVDKSKKKGAEKETEDGYTDTNKDDMYAMPMKKMGEMTDKGEGVVESAGVEEEQYDNTVGLRYEPKADRESGHQSEGDSKAPNAVILYAVVDKSRKKKK